MTPGYVRDVSKEGLLLAFPVPVGPTIGDHAYVEIIPNPETGFDPFSAEIEIRRIQQDRVFTFVGCSVVDYEDHSDAENFFEYVLKRGKTG